MIFTHIEIENYKGLQSTKTPLSNFSCVIGENNSGKSTLMQAILLFIDGTKLSSDKFYDPEKEICITVDCAGINEDTLAKLAEEHRPRLEPLVKDGTLRFIRKYKTDGTSILRVYQDLPTEDRFKDDNIQEIFRGKRGAAVTTTLESEYPEVDLGDDSVTTIAKAKEVIGEYIKSLPDESFTSTDVDLPTGMSNSIRSIFPEPVYIPAVKDLMDDLKIKESTSFGKLLNILLNVIEGELSEAKETFENLRKALNRVEEEDGEQSDNRLQKVQDIEATIQKNLQETFKDVSIELEVPPPEIKSILSNATIVADDGIKGSVDNKGDGFKRAITFSVLRSYVELSQNEEWRKEAEKNKAIRDRFLFLFEEPELYLHPHAQNILFDALSLIAENHQVIVTTHSPLFFSADDTKTFVKIAKQATNEQSKPVGTCLPIELSDLGEKEKFQLISFETSNLAFFSKKIVLVEGDSELIALPHIAKTYNPSWDFKTSSISLIKINGKGSFARYKKFFDRFDTQIALVTDLDILIDGFDKLEPTEEILRKRETLLTHIDQIIERENLQQNPNPRLIREELQRDRASGLYRQISEARGAGNNQQITHLLDEFFSFEKTKPRYEVLCSEDYQNVLDLKRELLSDLREQNIFVLEKGAIEAYYPDAVTGGDKPSKAQSFCSLTPNREDLNEVCNLLPSEGDEVPELELIMRGVFG